MKPTLPSGDRQTSDKIAGLETSASGSIQKHQAKRYFRQANYNTQFPSRVMPTLHRTVLMME